MSCDWLFACDKNAEEGKRHARDQLKKVFAVQERVSAPYVYIEAGHCVTPVGSRSGPRPSLSSGSFDNMKQAGSRLQLFHDNGHLSIQL